MTSSKATVSFHHTEDGRRWSLAIYNYYARCTFNEPYIHSREDWESFLNGEKDRLQFIDTILIWTDDKNDIVCHTMTGKEKGVETDYISIDFGDSHHLVDAIRTKLDSIGEEEWMPVTFPSVGDVVSATVKSVTEIGVYFTLKSGYEAFLLTQATALYAVGQVHSLIVARTDSGRQYIEVKEQLE